MAQVLQNPIISPAKSFTELINFIENRMAMKEIYQPLVIKKLVDLPVFKKEMCETLKTETGENKSFSDCPVFRVLQKHGIIIYNSVTKVLLLNVEQLDEKKKEEIKTLCDKKIIDFRGGKLI